MFFLNLLHNFIFLYALLSAARGITMHTHVKKRMKKCNAGRHFEFAGNTYCDFRKEVDLKVLDYSKQVWMCDGIVEYGINYSGNPCKDPYKAVYLYAIDDIQFRDLEGRRRSRRILKCMRAHH